MRIRSILIVLGLASAGTAAGQRSFGVVPFVGYRIGGGFTDTYNFRWDIKDALSYGGMFEFGMGPGAGVDLLYSHQATDVKTPPGYPIGGLASSYNLNVDNWLLGAWRGLSSGRRGAPPSSVVPVGIGYLGLTHFASSSGSNASADRFAAGLGLGVRALSPTGRLGLHLDARALWTFATGNGQWFCSLPGACVVTYTGTTMFQADFTAGVILVLGRSHAR